MMLHFPFFVHMIWAQEVEIEIAYLSKLKKFVLKLKNYHILVLIQNSLEMVEGFD